MPRHRNTVASELRTVRQALRLLLTSLDRVAVALANAPQSTTAGPAARPRRVLHLTQQRRASLKLQGRYMGYMRGLKPAQKSRVKKIRNTKGIRAAIAAAKKLAA